jgi:hypothetical protein
MRAAHANETPLPERIFLPALLSQPAPLYWWRVPRSEVFIQRPME